MAVRNQHARTSSNYIFVTYKDQLYYLKTGPFQQKSVIYNTKKKLLSGKLVIPETIKPKERQTILIVCLGNGEYEFDLI